MLGLCCRRQKCSGVAVLFVLAVCAGCGVLLLLLSRLRESTAALREHTRRTRDQHEALSAQLQVVYEHRSRLEKSLQRERLEHKKTKEDFLLYKLEAQEALNKEKQDALNRYSALTSQNNILKNQLADMRAQLLSQQTANGEQQLSQRRALEECRQMAALQRADSENRVAALQDTVIQLREQSKLLRRAPHDVHSQLLTAQVGKQKAKVEEFEPESQAEEIPPGAIIKWETRMGKHVGPQLQEHKDSVGLPSADPGRRLALVNSTQSGHRGQVTVPPLSQSKHKAPVDIELVATRSANKKDSEVIAMERWPGEEGQEHQLDSWNSMNRKNNFNQRPDKNFLSTNQKALPNHWQVVAANDMKNAVQEEVNEDRDFVERLDNGDLEIDSQGEEIAQGQGAIAQEPMEDGRMGDREDQLEEEEDEEEDGGNEEDY